MSHRVLVLLVALIAGLVSATSRAQSPRELDDVRALAAAGALELALGRIERGQPRQATAPDWAEWELTRFELLTRRQRHADVLSRMSAHPAEVRGSTAYIPLRVRAAQAAVALGRFAEARDFLVQAFLASEIGAEDYRSARRTAIDAFLGQGQTDAAYLAMLRFRQDFSPLRAAEAERFVAGLLTAGRADEAAQWLTLLEPGSPSGALLRLRAGLIPPAAAAAQARALIAQNVTDPGWTLLSAAGRALGDPAVELEVLEGRLNAAEPPAAQADTIGALWTAYAQFGERTANALQLLAGDDAQWLQAAERILPKQPRSARALAAALVLRARTSAARIRAQSLLLVWLHDAGLARTAWRLFSDAARFPVAELDSQVRRRLGELAAEVGEAAAGVRYWEGLPPMDGSSPQQWQAQVLALMLRAGRIADATRLADAALDAKGRLDAERIRALALAASDALDAGHAEIAQIVYRGLVAHARDAERMSVLTGLARAHEAGGDPRSAAEAYLLAASAAKEPKTDPSALAAREAAAIQLLRAGLRDDARAVLQWLARNAGPAAAKQAAERRLSRL
jgi:hypothetical protein